MKKFKNLKSIFSFLMVLNLLLSIFVLPVNATVDPGEGPDFVTIFNEVQTALNSEGIQTNISDCGVIPTSCSGLYFEKTGLGRVEFDQSLDLTDPDVVTSLQNLGDYLDISQGHIGFDSDLAETMGAMGASLTLYGLEGYDSEPSLIVSDDEGSVIDPSDENYPEIITEWDSDAGTLNFTTSHFTQFDIDDEEDSGDGDSGSGDTDSDGDGISDSADNCVNNANPDQADVDGDQIGNACDNCPNVVNIDQADADSDGIGDSCDNSPTVANPGQEDRDGDRVGDVSDNCPDNSNTDQADTDDDGIGDVCDAYNCHATDGEIYGDGVDNDCDGTIDNRLNEDPSPTAIAPGDTLTVFGNDLNYVDANSTEICFDGGGSCIKASDPEIIYWTETEISVRPEIFNGSNYALQDYRGGIIIYIDGVRINGWDLGNVPVYYLKPIINNIFVDGDYIHVTGENSYTYNSFLPFRDFDGSVIIDDQELPVEYEGNAIKALLSEELKNVGNVEIKVKNGYGIESDPFMFRLDSIAPVFDFISPTPADGARINFQPQFRIKANESLASAWLSLGLVNGNFELGNLDNFTTGGSANWYVDSGTKYEGAYSARSGNMSGWNNVNSWLKRTVNVSSGSNISFYWKVSSEGGWDYLTFYIDGVAQNSISGWVDWQNKSYNLSAGTHELMWYYSKDGSVTSGSDAGWVDNITINGASGNDGYEMIIDENDSTQAYYNISGLGEGYNQYNVTVTDLASNSQTSDNRSFTLDTTAPEMVSASAIAVRQIEVVFDEDLIGEDLTVGDFQVISNETEIGIESVGEENGEVILNLLSDLTSQTPTIIINPSIPQSIKDVAGNEQTQTNIRVASDKIAPIVDAGSSPSKNRVEFTQNATVGDGVGGSGIAGYEWSVVNTPDDETAEVIFGTPNVEDTTISANVDGEYTIRLTVTDNAGNIASDDVTFEWGAPSGRRRIQYEDTTNSDTGTTGSDESVSSENTSDSSTTSNTENSTESESATESETTTETTIPATEETSTPESVIAPQTPSIDAGGKVLGVKVILLDELITKLKFGDRGDEVNDLQNELQRLGFFPSYVKTTKYYGPITASAVAKYLASKGCTKVKTIDDLIAITKFGMRNENVKALQTELSNIDYFPKNVITGYFWTITRASVAKYQSECK